MRCKRRGAFPSISALFLVVSFLTAPSAGADSLAFSCATGDIEAVRSALAGGANPNAPDEYGFPPLCRTVSAGVDAPLSMHLEVIRLLVGSGAKIDAPSPGGDTPLLLSLRKGRSFTEVTELLLELGADPDGPGPTGPDGERPLNAAAREPASVRQLELLLSRGADVRLEDGTGRSPLESAVTSPHPSCCSMPGQTSTKPSACGRRRGSRRSWPPPPWGLPTSSACCWTAARWPPFRAVRGSGRAITPCARDGRRTPPYCPDLLLP